jgi:hypothetical protein
MASKVDQRDDDLSSSFNINRPIRCRLRRGARGTATDYARPTHGQFANALVKAPGGIAGASQCLLSYISRRVILNGKIRARMRLLSIGCVSYAAKLCAAHRANVAISNGPARDRRQIVATAAAT